MKYYNDLLTALLFKKEKLNWLTGNADTAKAVLKSYLKKGYIEKIRHNYYGVKSLETKQIAANRFEIASNINEHAYISHHTAFEYFGMTNQVVATVYVSSSSNFESFEFDGVWYKCIVPGIDEGVVQETRHIRITDLERTIADSIKDFTKVGGLEELLRCLTMVLFVDETELLRDLSAYDNQFLYQKTGYILSHYKDSMQLSDGFFEACKKKIKKSVRYLYPGIQFENPEYDSEWQLFVPKNLMKKIDEGGDEIV